MAEFEDEVFDFIQHSSHHQHQVEEDSKVNPRNPTPIQDFLNKCVNCNKKLLISSGAGRRAAQSSCCRYLHQSFNFRGSNTGNIRNTTRSSSSLIELEPKLKLTLYEALDLIFQISDETIRERIITNGDEFPICADCLSVFTPLFQLYLQFVSISQSDSLIGNVLQTTTAVQRSLQGYLRMMQKQLKQSIQEDPLLINDCNDDYKGVTSASAKDDVSNAEFVLPTSPTVLSPQLSSCFIEEMKQEFEAVQEEIKVDVDLEFDDLTDLCDNNDGGGNEYEETSMLRSRLQAAEEVHQSKNIPTKQSTRQSSRRLRPTPTSSTNFKVVRHVSPALKKKKYIPRPASKVNCPKCCETFLGTSRLKIHLQVHDKGNPKFHCSICDCDFSRKKVLRKHMARVHPNVKINDNNDHNNFPCTLCSLEFSPASRLRKHYISQHLYCPLCKTEFPTKADISAHMRTSHDSRRTKRTHACEVCDFKTKRLRDLQKHKILKHQQVQDEQKHRVKSCHFCGKPFLDNHSLQRHLVVHTEDRPFKCEQCSMTFKHKENLTTHKLYKHDGIKFICEICGLASSSPANLRKHVRGVHQRICQTQKKPSPDKPRKKRIRFPVPPPVAVMQASSEESP